jgi:hypothetical protein
VSEHVIAREAIVGPEKQHPFPAGAGDAFVHRRINAAVRFRDERAEAGALRLQPVAGAVGRGAVDDHDFEIGGLLRPKAGEGVAQTGARISADDDDAEQRR